MKKILFLLIVVLLTGCEKYEEVSEPVLYMGGGKWTFIDYVPMHPNQLNFRIQKVHALGDPNEWLDCYTP